MLTIENECFVLSGFYVTDSPAKWSILGTGRAAISRGAAAQRCHSRTGYCQIKPKHCSAIGHLGGNNSPQNVKPDQRKNEKKKRELKLQIDGRTKCHLDSISVFGFCRRISDLNNRLPNKAFQFGFVFLFSAESAFNSSDNGIIIIEFICSNGEPFRLNQKQLVIPSAQMKFPRFPTISLFDGTPVPSRPTNQVLSPSPAFVFRRSPFALFAG